MILDPKVTKATQDVFKGVNANIWDGVEGVEKASKIIKTGLSGADVVIGASHTIEDLWMSGLRLYESQHCCQYLQCGCHGTRKYSQH